MGRVIRALAGHNKDILIAISDSTDVVKRAQDIHQTTPVATAALGRTLTAVHLMATALKNDKANVSLQINGSAELKKIYAYADARGHLKGYVSHPNASVKLKENGKLDVGAIVGKHGKLLVTRDLGYGKPFVGQSGLVTGEIAEDLAHYYMYSEQQPSVVSLGVFVDGQGIPQAAGGLMIQTLPGVLEESLVALEGRLPHIRTMSTMVGEGLTLEMMLDEILADIPYSVLSDQTFAYNCDCTHDKVERALMTLGVTELESILKEDGHAELNCHYCNKRYHYDSLDLKAMISHIREA